MQIAELLPSPTTPYIILIEILFKRKGSSVYPKLRVKGLQAETYNIVHFEDKNQENIPFKELGARDCFLFKQ